MPVGSARTPQEKVLYQRLAAIAQGQADEVTTRETLIELAVRDTLQRDRSGQPTGHAAGSLTQALDTAIVGATRAEDARSFSQLRAYFRAVGTRVRGVLGTLGQLKRAQAQGHLPSGGDWAQ